MPVVAHRIVSKHTRARIVHIITATAEAGTCPDLEVTEWKSPPYRAASNEQVVNTKKTCLAAAVVRFSSCWTLHCMTSLQNVAALQVQTPMTKDPNITKLVGITEERYVFTWHETRHQGTHLRHLDYCHVRYVLSICTVE